MCNSYSNVYVIIINIVIKFAVPNHVTAKESYHYTVGPCNHCFGIISIMTYIEKKGLILLVTAKLPKL